MHLSRTVAVLVLGLAVSACAPGDDLTPIQACGPNGSCPASYSCSPLDNHCYSSGEKPETEITSQPPALTNQAHVSVAFSSMSSGTFECALDQAAFAPCTSPDGLDAGAGAHTFAVRAISVHGFPDTTPATASWTTDLTPPTTSIGGGPGAVTTSGDATFTFSASEPSSFECSLDGAAFAPCPASFTGLGDGVHSLIVRAVDEAGNVDPDPPSTSWRVDRSGPSPTITSGPDEGTVTGRDVSLAFTVEPGGRYQCTLDVQAPADCSSGNVAYTGLAAGPHTFTVKGTDSVGNAGMPVTRSWTVDAAGPTVTLTSAPAPGSTTGPDVTLAFSASTPGSSFSCALDAAAFAACLSPLALHDLGAGSHTFHVRATDPQQVTGGETAVTWMVDRTPPMVTIVSPASGSTNPSTVMVVWTSDDLTATFACALDGGAAKACASPDLLMGLTGGAHHFVLSATDSVGNSASPPALEFAVNDPPTISMVTDQSTDEDVPLAGIAFTVGDAQTAAADLVVTATADDGALFPPDALVLSGSGAERTLALTPAPNENGNATVTLTVSDGALSAVTTFRVTVRPVPDAPTIAAIGPQSTSEGVPATIAFTIADVDSPLDGLTVTAMSSNAAVVPDSALALGGAGASRTLTVIPVTSGSADITVAVSDGTSTTRATFTLTVAAVIHAPTVSAIEPQTTLEDTATGAIAFTIADLDTPIGDLTVTASSDTPALLPAAGIVLGGSGGDRTLTLTPAPDQNGTATVTISVSDGTSSTTTSFVLTVTPVDDAPTIAAIGPQSTSESTPTPPIPFTIGDVDSPADGLTVSATSSNPTLLPGSAVTFAGTGTTRTMTLAPAAGQSGSAVVTVTVSDGTLSSSTSFTLSVGAVDDPPTIGDVHDQSTSEDTPLAVAIAVGDSDTPLASLALTASSSNAALVPPAGLVLGGSGAARTLTITPAANQSGQATITVSVSDGTSTRSDTFVLTVTAVNDAPAISDVGPQSTNEDTPLTASFTVSDVETPAGSLTVTGTSSNPTLLPSAGITFGVAGGNRTVTLTPAPNQNGTATVTLTVSDGALTASDTFVLTVNAVNDPPVISMPGAQTTNEDTPISVAFTVSDVETAAGSLTVTATSSDTTVLPQAGIVLGGSGGNRTVTLTPGANQSGTATVTLTVSDGAAQASSSFALTVSAVNDAPTVSSVANQTINEDGSTGALSFTVGDVETPAGSLTVTGSSSNSALVPSANIVFGGSGASRTVTIAPAANANGVATITLTVSDGTTTTSTTFTLTVNAVNDPPTISSIANQTINEDGGTGALAFTIGDVETPAGSLTVSGSSSNSGLVPSANIVFGGSGAARTVTVTPAANASGLATITLNVSDGTTSTSTSFALTVNAVNDAPTISSIANQTTTQGAAVGPIAFTVGDVESGAGPLTLSGASSNPAVVPVSGIAFGGSGANRNVTITPTQTTGTATITVSVSDGSLSTPTSFTVTVNTAPTVTVAWSATPASAGDVVIVGCVNLPSCPKPVGSPVTIFAVTFGPTVTFTGWSGASCPVAGQTTTPATFTVPSTPVSCTANFIAPCWVGCTGACEGNVCYENSTLAIDGQNAYWTRVALGTDGNPAGTVRVYKSPLSGGAGTRLAEIAADGIDMKQRGGLLYVETDNSIYTVDKSSGAAISLQNGGFFGTDLEVDATHAWFVMDGLGIFRKDLADNIMVQVLPHTHMSGLEGLTSDAQNLYWFDGDELRTADKTALVATDLKQVTVPDESSARFTRMFLSGNDLVWRINGAGQGWYDRSTGTLTETASVDGDFPFAADAAGIYFYVGDSTFGSIAYQAGPTADVDEDYIDVPSPPPNESVCDIAVDATSVYMLWSNQLVRMPKP